MSKLTIFAALAVVLVGVAQGSLFGPFGPFGPFAQPAAPQQPGWPGAVFPAYPSFPAFGPPVNLPAFGPPAGVLPFSRALPGAGVPATGAGAASGGKFRAKPSGVLERLAVANLPADLQARYDELLVVSEQGNAACDEAYPGAVGPFAGLHRRCVVLQKAETERAATALEQEANDRAAADAAAAAASAAAAEADVAV